MKNRTIFAALALLLAFATSPAWARPAPPEPGTGSPPAPTATAAPAPTAVPPTITPVQLPAVGGSDAAPAATPAPSTSCPTFTGASSDFSTFYVKCGETAETYYGPGGAKNGGSVGPGTYTVQNDRRCFAGSVELNCETFQGGVQPNWFLLEAGWVTNGVEYSAPNQPAATSSAPASVPSQSGSFAYNLAYYSYLTSSIDAETQSTPGSISLSSGSGYVTWVVSKNGQVIQGPTTFNVQAGKTQFNIYWQWPGVPVNLVTGVPDDDEIPTVVMQATLYAADGTQLSVAPAISVSYQYQPPLGPGPTPEPGHSDPRD